MQVSCRYHAADLHLEQTQVSSEECPITDSAITDRLNTDMV